MKKVVNLVVTGLILSACSTDLVIDPRVGDQSNLWRDQQECESIAEDVDPMATSMMIDGLLGALLIGGMAAGAHAMDSSVGDFTIGEQAAIGAGAGALTGIALAGINVSQAQERTKRNCLEGRGYSILN